MSTSAFSPTTLRPLVIRAAPLVLLLLYGVLGGAAFTVSKIAIGAGVPPLGYALWQSGGTFVVLLLITVLSGARLAFASDHLRLYAVCGVVGIACPAIVMYSAIAHIQAGVMGAIVATIPLFTFVIAQALGIERGSWWRLSGLVLGLAGALLIVLPGSSLPDGNIVGWAAFAFLAPLCFAVGGIFAAVRRPEASSALGLATGMLALSTLALLPAVVVSGSFYWPQANWGVAETAITVHLAISSLGYLLFFELTRRSGAVYCSQVGYVVTVTAIGWASALLGETYAPATYVAVLLIFAGVALVNGRGRHGAAIARRVWRTQGEGQGSNKEILRGRILGS